MSLKHKAKPFSLPETPQLGGPRCMGKLSYADKKSAKIAIRWFVANGAPDAKFLKAFRCAICPCFHVGRCEPSSPRDALRGIRQQKGESL